LAGKVQRSKPTRSRPARPSQKKYPQTRVETLVLIGVGVVLVVAAGVVLVGLFITQYLPPRAHVLTIEGHSYSAQDLKARGSYMLRYETDFAKGATQDNLVDLTVDRVTRDEVVLLRAPAVVGEVTDADVKESLRERLGFVAVTPAPASSAVPGASSTPAATQTTVATPDAAARAQTEADFARAEQDLYRSAGLGSSKYEDVLRVGLLEQRLQDKFSAELGTTAPQIHLQAIRVADQATAPRVRDQAIAGSDFVRLAAQYSITQTAKADGGELDWQLMETLAPDVRAAVESLPSGQLSKIIPVDRFFEVYRVVEAKTDRPLTATQKQTLINNRVTAWYDGERANVTVEPDISSAERTWIRDGIITDAQKRGAKSTPTPTATATRSP
jgi:parvulin-like peptidyl-prolyl isomerase